MASVSPLKIGPEDDQPAQPIVFQPHAIIHLNGKSLFVASSEGSQQQSNV
jgi:hypothetical protein